MSFNYFENTAQLDEHLVSFDKVPVAADKDNVVKRIKKKWDGVMSDLNGLAGIKLAKPDFDALADEAIDKTAKAKASDPARVAALKAINAALQDYYKTF